MFFYSTVGFDLLSSVDVPLSPSLSLQKSPSQASQGKAKTVLKKQGMRDLKSSSGQLAPPTPAQEQSSGSPNHESQTPQGLASTAQSKPSSFLFSAFNLHLSSSSSSSTHQNDTSQPSEKEKTVSSSWWGSSGSKPKQPPS